MTYGAIALDGGTGCHAVRVASGYPVSEFCI
jgi:hypothetical protein